MGEVVQIRPQEGPQERFLSTSADICIYGGAAGGGKSWSLIFEGARHKDVPGFSGVLFRRTSPELKGGGSLWAEAEGLYPQLGGVGREGADMDWRWKSNAVVQFRHMQHEKDRTQHQGKQYAYIGFDEVTHFTEKQFWYLVSRNRSTCGVRPYIRSTCNPDPDSWVRKMIDWWIGDDGFAIPERSGVVRYFLRLDETLVWAETAAELEGLYPQLTTELVDANGNYPRPKSFTFIPSKLTDNKILMAADPGYMANLLALPRVEREQLLGGNWNIRPAAGLYFNRAMFEVIDLVVEKDVKRRARGWDLAATKVTDATPDPDYTASVRIAELRDGSFVIEDMTEMRGSPGEVETALVNIASQDGRRVGVGLWQDPGAAGKADAQRKVGLLRGYRARAIPAAKDKVTYAGPLSAQCEAGNVKLLRGDWNERFYQVFGGFPDAKHDDAVDGASRAFIDLTNTAANWLQDMKAAAQNGRAA